MTTRNTEPVTPIYALAVGAELADAAAAMPGRSPADAELLREIAACLRAGVDFCNRSDIMYGTKADYDARHGARSDGFPPSDADPATGAQYGEAI